MAYGTRKSNKACVPKDSPIIPIHGQIYPIPSIDTYFFNIHSNIVLPSTQAFLQVSFLKI